ncbi:MAG: efflux RND transporter periplasmic adaptor subunit, partial [Acidobacteriota bacterium]|nr:efflux RND transporter periplasmic adaptor subunit [Acidobacteriota bacterium]
MREFVPQINRTSRGGRQVPGRQLLQVILLAGLAAAVACGSGEEAAGPGGGSGPGGRPGGGPPGGFGGGSAPVTAVPVEVMEILPGPISAFIETNGTLEAEREVDIVARTGGPLVALNTEEGVQVQAGEVLAQIDELEARAQVEISRVALQDAENAYERAKASLENAIVSQEVYDQAFSAFESAKAQLAGNEIQLGYTRITAPFDGLIIQRAVKFGETVTAGQQLFRISDFDPLLCVIGVPERDLARLSVGQPAILRVEAFPGEQFQGRVLRISPVVDSATGTIRVTLEVNRQGRLSPGMFAGVRLVTDVREDALIMPKRALSLESLADSVFVVEDGAAYRRNVILGYEEDDRVEVTSGLDRGDRVIVVGQDGLTDATPVQILAGPGAEERPARTAGAASGGGFEMTEERRAAMRERMRARGMTDEAIDERLAAMAAGGGPPGGRGRPGAG